MSYTDYEMKLCEADEEIKQLEQENEKLRELLVEAYYIIDEVFKADCIDEIPLFNFLHKPEIQRLLKRGGE